jgi:aspartate/methionine/tyrosine aminotransferase
LPSVKKYFPDLGSEDIFPYAPIPGHPEFRAAWMKYILHKAGDRADAIKDNLTLPMTASGITGALYIVMKMFADSMKRWVPREAVGQFTTMWSSKTLSKFRSSFSSRIPVNIRPDRAIEKSGRNRKMRRTLNFPNKPTGSCHPGELRKCEVFCRRRGSARKLSWCSTSLTRLTFTTKKP